MNKYQITVKRTLTKVWEETYTIGAFSEDDIKRRFRNVDPHLKRIPDEVVLINEKEFFNIENIKETTNGITK